MAKPLAALHRLWVHHKPTVIMMVAAIAAAVFFAVQVNDRGRDWRDRPAEAAPIEPWMTVRFVARSYLVRPALISDAIGAEKTRWKLSLEELAALQGRPVEDLIADLEAFLAEHRPPRREPRGQ